MQSIELYTLQTQEARLYPTAGRERVFASDREIRILCHWSLPKPGDYISKVILRTPTGSIYREQEHRFQAEAPSWLTAQRYEFPQGELAKPLAGRWQVEVALGDALVGRRAFTFDPSSIHLRTDARLVLIQGNAYAEDYKGGWFFLRGSAIAEATLAILEVALRDELARRFPHVDGPRQTPDTDDAVVLLTPNLWISPSPLVDTRLELEVVHVPTKLVRKFNFKSSAGIEFVRQSSAEFHPGVMAADLAFQAASSPEVITFLSLITAAVPD